jgi:aconitate hydratase
MGILPLEFQREENAQTLGLTGDEVFNIVGQSDLFAGGFPEERAVKVEAVRPDEAVVAFTARVRIDTPQEAIYYRHGGILQYVLRQLLSGRETAESVSGGVATLPGA